MYFRDHYLSLHKAHPLSFQAACCFIAYKNHNLSGSHYWWPVNGNLLPLQTQRHTQLSKHCHQTLDSANLVKTSISLSFKFLFLIVLAKLSFQCIRAICISSLVSFKNWAGFNRFLDLQRLLLGKFATCLDLSCNSFLLVCYLSLFMVICYAEVYFYDCINVLFNSLRRMLCLS